MRTLLALPLLLTLTLIGSLGAASAALALEPIAIDSPDSLAVAGPDECP